jgi:cytoskeleton protein RodZ
MSSPDDLSWLADVGSRLRERRVSSGISLEEAAEQTRLSVRQIVAIEEGDRSRLPADVYVRGFVRVYARALGLPDPGPVAGDLSLNPPPPGG